MTLVAAYSRPYLLVTLISGLFFWSVAALVFAPRVDQPAVHLFFWISILYGTGVLVGGVYGQSWPLGYILSTAPAATDEPGLSCRRPFCT